MKLEADFQSHNLLHCMVVLGTKALRIPAMEFGFHQMLCCDSFPVAPDLSSVQVERDYRAQFLRQEQKRLHPRKDAGSRAKADRATQELILIQSLNTRGRFLSFTSCGIPLQTIFSLGRGTKAFFNVSPPIQNSSSEFRTFHISTANTFV